MLILQSCSSMGNSEWSIGQERATVSLKIMFFLLSKFSKILYCRPCAVENVSILCDANKGIIFSDIVDASLLLI